MKAAITIPLSALLVAGWTAQASEPEPASAEAQAKLARETAGFVPAGPPVDCVRMKDLEDNHGVDQRTIVFEARGSRLYVNHTRNTCPELKNTRVLRIRTTQTQLCSGELATVFDPSTGVEYGGCALGDFTPYRRGS